MEAYASLVPLVILAPALGAFFNIVWGQAMGERAAGYLASGMSIFTFIISVLLFTYVSATHGLGAVVDPPVFDGWIRVAASEFNIDIPWQFRIDTLTVTMLLVVTGVGSLIHIYSIGYIHGDPKAGTFFGYLNLFLMFMLILVTGNNFLMMFVGWEGVGLCSFLLIGYWWDKPGAVGWKNSNAARKAMILNRIGDFGILMSVFLIFWTFGTLDYFRGGEVANPIYQLKVNGYEPSEEMLALYGAEEGEHGEEEHSEEGAAAEGEEHTEEEATSEEHSEETAAEDEHAEEAVAAEGEHSEEEDHGEGGHSYTAEELDNSLFRPEQLGVFGQAVRLMHLEEGETIAWSVDADGNSVERGREVHFGAFSLDIQIVLVLIVLFMLLGAAGKSAQIPLFVWLPDAMAGPTPVSALMHAATMVTAGVYLLVRSSVFLDLVPEARFVIAVIGGLTALVGGFTALGQWDVKRVLAYSTVSQLGFMIAAVGIGAYVAAIFHLVTHAVFKALLFLGSGSIIHGVEHGHHHVHEHAHGHDDHGHDDHHDDHHEDDFDPQDMRNMGGLAGRMPATFVTYLIGTFALSGLPIFAGFWSKDEILADAWYEAFFGHTLLDNLGGFLVLGMLLVAAGFTAFYMWRQIQMVFFGEPRSEAADHAPESTLWMTVPLVILAIGATFIGLINVPRGAWPFISFYKEYEFKHFLEGAIPSITTGHTLTFNWLLAGIATALAGLAIFLAHSIYAGNKAVVNRDEHNLGEDPLFVNRTTRSAWSFANARMHWDAFYGATIEQPFNRAGDFLANVIDWNFLHDYVHDRVIKRGFDAVGNFLKEPIDLGLIDGIVNGVGRVVAFFSGRIRGMQTGYVRTYALTLLLGVVIVVLLMLVPLIQLALNGS